MRDTRHTTSASLGYGFLLSLLLGVIGAIVYHSWEAGAAIFALAWLTDMIALLGFIPVAGPFLYWGTFVWLETQLLSLAGIQPSFLTNLIFWLGMAFAILYTILSSMVALIVIAAIFDD